MNWLTKVVRPKIRALVGKKDVPDDLWYKCAKCAQMLFHKELEENLHVCHHCGHHLRLSAVRRLDMLFDDGAYNRIELPEVAVDPLKFKDRKRYTDRLRDAQANAVKQNGGADAVIVAHGTIGGQKSVIAAFDFGFLGGSMGQAVGEALIAAAQLAIVQRAPLIVIPSTGGARMQEGILSLMQLPRTVLAVEEVREAGLPYIVVLTDPTTGGVTASFAMLGDIHIAEKGATIGFAGKRVIKDTIRTELPEGFQRAEYMLEHGMVDIVVHRKDLRGTLGRIIDLLVRRTPSAEIVPLDAVANLGAENFKGKTPTVGSALTPVSQDLAADD